MACQLMKAMIFASGRTYGTQLGVSLNKDAPSNPSSSHAYDSLRISLEHVSHPTWECVSSFVARNVVPDGILDGGDGISQNVFGKAV